MQKMKYEGPASARLYTNWPDDVSYLRAALGKDDIFVSKETAIRAWMAVNVRHFQGGWRVPFGEDHEFILTTMREFLVDDASPIDPDLDNRDPVQASPPLAVRFSMRRQCLVPVNAEDHAEAMRIRGTAASDARMSEAVEEDGFPETVMEPPEPEEPVVAEPDLASGSPRDPIRNVETGKFDTREKLVKAVLRLDRDYIPSVIATKVKISEAMVKRILKERV